MLRVLFHLSYTLTIAVLLYFAVCDAGSTWMDYVSIPPEVNVTAVEDFICSANFTVLLAELMQRFNIDDIIIAFQPNATVTPDWTKVTGTLTL